MGSYPKPPVPRGAGGDAAAACPSGRPRAPTPPRGPTLLGKRDRQHADVAGPAPVGRKAPQRLEQLRVVGFVGGIFSREPACAHARGAVESIDLDARMSARVGTPPPRRPNRALIAAFVSKVAPLSTGSPPMPRSSSDTRSVWRSPRSSRSSRSLWTDRVATSNAGASPRRPASRGGRPPKVRPAATVGPWPAPPPLSNSCARPASARSSRPSVAARSNGPPSACSGARRTRLRQCRRR